MRSKVAGSRGQSTSSFLPAMSPRLSTFPPALSKAGPLLCSVSFPKWQRCPAAPSVVFPSGVTPSRLWLWPLIGTKIVVVTTGPWHIANESARYKMQQLPASAEHQMPSEMTVYCGHSGHIHGDWSAHVPAAHPAHSLAPQGSEYKLGRAQRQFPAES